MVGRTWRRLAAACLVIIGLVTVATVGTPSPADAAVVRSFTPRFRANDRGDIYAIGNTLVTCAESTQCTRARNGEGSQLSNNDHAGAYVDVDGIGSTTNSSQATLTLPAGSSVLWAGLYWGGSASAGNTSRGSIRLMPPGGSYSTITGTVTTGTVATTGGVPYGAVADVTSLVQTSGTYTVGGLTTTLGMNARGAWSLIVVVRDPTQPLRNLSVFDGFAEINISPADSTVTTTVSGFVTPTTGTVSARVGAMTFEGDLGLTGDAFQFNGVSLTNSLNPASNFWNSSVTRLGSRLSAKNPDYVNQLGFDLDYLAAPAGAITNGQTSATVRFTTGGESYEPMALFTAIDIFEPTLAVSKTAAKVGTGAKLNPGDQVEYTMTVASTGNEAANSSLLLDPLPAGVTYVPGSLRIDGATVTDVAGDDRGEYRSADRTVAFRLGTGASATAAGSLAPGTSTTVQFRVTVNSPSGTNVQISNQAEVRYISPTTGATYTTPSDDPNVNGVPNSTSFDVNDAPVANPVTVTTAEDTAVAVDVSASASDPDDTALTFTNTQPPAGRGSVTCTATGACTYTPPANFSGTATFTYTATDSGGRATTGTVTVTVNPVNDAPVATSDTVTTAEDTAVTVNVAANDTDIDGGPLTVSIVTQGTRGTVACTGASCTYTPNADVNGSDTFTYTVSDGNGGTSTATVNVTITAVNDPPQATAAAATTPEDTAVSIDVLAGDTDRDGDAVRLLSFTQPPTGTGTVTCTANTGPCTFTPAAHVNGQVSFTYTITDRPGTGGLTSTAGVTVTITPVNDPPFGVADAATTTEDTAVTTNVLANDVDIDGGPPRVASFTQPSNGSVTCVAATGACTYTPAPNFSGTDSYTYDVNDGNGGQTTGRVTVTVSAVNDAPVAVDDAVATDEDTPVTVAVLGNDTDIEGDSLRVVSATQPDRGSVTCTPTACTYTPPANATGTASFTYTISDRPGTGGPTDVATVTVTIGALNDPPIAVADTLATNEDTAATVNVLANDSDPDDATASLRIGTVTQPSRGTVTCEPTGACTYRPNPNASGPDSFTYSVTDPGGATAVTTVTVTVAAVNDPPVAGADTASTNEDTAVTIDVRPGDGDVDGDTLTWALASPPSTGTASCTAGGACTYTPAPNTSGTDTFTYTVSDGNGATATGTVTVTVRPVNDPPVAAADAFPATEDTPVTFGVLVNDADADGDTITVTSVTRPGRGTVTCTPAGSCTYTPNRDATGSDTFQYSIDDGRGGSATANVTLTVAPVNDAPVAVDDAASTPEDTAVEIDVAADDVDVDGDELTVAVASPPSRGSVTCTAPRGPCTYTPATNVNGADSFTYTVDDGNGGTDTAIVVLSIGAVNDPPAATADAATTAEDTPVTFSVLGNDGDVDSGDAISLVDHGQPANGTVECAPDGACTYTPNRDVVGNDSFTYTIADRSGATAQATVTVAVTPVNDPPVADDDAVATDEDAAVVVDVLDGDADVDGGALTVTAVTRPPSSGTVTCAPDGECTYTPDPNVGGDDSFEYEVSDGNGGTDRGVVTILIRSVNDRPVADDDDASTAEDTAVTIAVLDGDSDPDGDTLTITSTTSPRNGSVHVHARAQLQRHRHLQLPDQRRQWCE